MKEASITARSVPDLRPSDKCSLEGLIGQPLEDDQQVFIVVLNPSSEPDELTRCLARAGLEATFQKTSAYSDARGITDDEIESAIQEAFQHVRERND